MATFLDIGLLHKFEIIFPFLFVFVIVWGLLSYSKFLGENKFLHSIVALVLGILVLFSDSTREIINGMAPWFVIILVFIVLLLIALKSFGATDSDITAQFGWLKPIIVGILIFMVIFTIIDIKVWNNDTETSADTVTGGDVGDGGKSAFFATMRTQAVLGLILIFLIAMFSIMFISRTD